MDFLSAITLSMQSLSVSERRVAEFILENPDVASRMSIVAIANAADVSLPTVTRLTRKLGFEGFSDFKFALVSSLSEKQAYSEKGMERTEANYDPASHFGRTIRSIILTAQSVSEEDIMEVAERIIKARRVFVIAADVSALYGSLLADRLLKLGLDTTSITDNMALPVAIQNSTEKDVHIIISCSSHSKATLDALKATDVCSSYKVFVCNYMNTQAHNIADKYLMAARVDRLDRSTAFAPDISLSAVLNMLIEKIKGD